VRRDIRRKEEKRSHIHTRTHKFIHTYIHTYTHTHTHTHTHTYHHFTVEMRVDIVSCSNEARQEEREWELEWSLIELLNSVVVLRHKPPIRSLEERGEREMRGDKERERSVLQLQHAVVYRVESILCHIEPLVMKKVDSQDHNPLYNKTAN
jgi:hypothetical protein